MGTGANSLNFPGMNSLMHEVDPELADIATLEATVALIATTATMHFYADGTTGDDANSGLTALLPKKTLSAVFALIPKLVRHNVCVHLSGTFQLGADWGGYYYEYLLLTHHVDDGVMILIDGGADYAVVADNGGSAWAADIASTTAVGLTTAGWTVNAYRGYMVEITTGVAAGQTRMIQSNTATTITPCRNFDGTLPPAAGDGFRIVRPLTRLQINAAATFGGFAGYMFQGAHTFGKVFWQRLSLGDTVQLGTEDGMILGFSHIVSDATAGTYPIYVYSGSRVDLVGGYYDTTWFYQVTDATASNVGVGVPGGTGPRLACVNGFGIFIYSSVLSACNVYNSVLTDVSRGTFVFRGFGMYGCTFNEGYALASGGCFATTSGFATTRITGYQLSGLYMENSKCRVEAGVDFSNCSLFGIEMYDSDLVLGGTNAARVTGSANANCGVLARNCSRVQFVEAYPPTLTGVGGDVMVGNHVVADTTWAAISGVYTNLTEATVITNNYRPSAE